MLGSHRSLGWSYNYTYMTYICQLYIRGMGLFLGDIHLGMCGRCRASCGSHPHQHKCFSVAFRPWFVGDLRTFCSVHAQLILRDSPMFSKKKQGLFRLSKHHFFARSFGDLADFGSLNIFSLVFMAHIPVIFQLSSYIHGGFLQWGYPNSTLDGFSHRKIQKIP